MVEITYDMDDPPNGVYGIISGLYVDDVDPLSYIWHTQPFANLRKRRVSDRAIVQGTNVSAANTAIDLRPDGDVYHAVGPDLYRRDSSLESVWKVAPNQSAIVSDVAATGGSGPVAATENRLYLYNPSNGAFKWSRETPSTEDVSTVAADDNRDIYATEAIGETVKYKTTGVVEWRNTSRSGDMVAVWRDDHVYVSARNTDDIVQLDSSDGTENWNRNDAFGSPSGLGVTGDGDAVVVHTNGVARLASADGTSVWNNTSVNYQDVETAVSVRNGGNIIVFGNETLAALDPSTGTEQWSLTVSETSDLFDMVSYPSPGAYYSELW